MRIKQVQIQNIKGIEKLSFEPGTLTVVVGDNGTGKTSILSAIRAVFEGGHDPDLIRQGQESGSVTLTLDDGTVIRTKITPAKTSRDITTGDGLKVPKVAAFLETLAKGFQMDPLAFLDADPKRRAQYLIEAMPLSFTPEEIQSATGRQIVRPLDLDGITALRESIYDERRALNAVVRDLDGVVANLKAGLGDDIDGDWSQIADELATKQASARADLARVESDVTRDANAARESAQSGFETAKTLAMREYQEAVAKAKSTMDAALANAQGVRDTLLAEVAEGEREAIREQTAELQAQLQQISAELMQAQERRDSQRRLSSVKAELDKANNRRADRIRESDGLTLALEGLDKLKAEKLAESPIPDVTVENGRILVGGLPLDELNTQKQYFIAFQLAGLQQGKLPFMICDRAESMVGAQWEDFQSAASESGYQVICARAEAGEELRIVTDGGAK